MPLPESFMQDLKSRCDITDIVSSYVNLKRRGKTVCLPHGIAHKQGADTQIDYSEQAQMPEAGLDIFQ